MIANTLVEVNNRLGNLTFILLSVALSAVLCFKAIPFTTDLMVNSAAGLAGKYFGSKQRTLVINASTNNPELFSMLISLGLLRLGGIANPLGSNFTNMYLMFFIAPVLVASKWLFTGRFDKLSSLGSLVNKERRLFLWHTAIAFFMFIFASLAYWCLTGGFQFWPVTKNTPREWYWLATAGILAVCGVFLYFFFERKLKRQRPELFDDINDEQQTASWSAFAIGTIGLIGSTYIINSLFLAFTELYSDSLSSFFGVAMFAGLHYFVGSIVTSLPELTVATENFERLTSPDLNTALASASGSNMTNLAIAAIGAILATVIAGFHFQISL